MSEMIYGNTGRRDEGINIDLESALYQKLQSRTFVPKLKSMLSDKHQEGDKNFVFIGEVTDKTGNFTVYGYNAKLESDSRGGDYGHYVAVPMDEKAVSPDVSNIRFLSEEGFVEYVNLKTLNDEKRFTISAIPVQIEENAKKRIVNNLMETFMKVRKRKNVTVSFADCAVDQFNSKSLFVLMDIMKYLPLRMRKNVSFISHVMSNQKLPDTVNFAVYPDDCEFKPHDCISLDETTPISGDAVFAGYVDKVFAMTDSEREQYLEKLHRDIELPAMEKGVDVKSGLYLIDISTKQLWQSGESKEAVANIFASVEDILKVYDEYKQIAKVRLEAEKEAVMEYIVTSVSACSNTDELKAVYTTVSAVFELCSFGDHFLDFANDVRIHFTLRANELMSAALTDDSLVKILSGIVSIDEAVLDKAYTLGIYKEHMAKKTDTNSMHVLYLKLKEKVFIDPHELNLCLEDAVNELISRVTGRYTDAKDRLAALERMYGEFKSTTAAKDYPMIDRIYDKYRDKFTGNANEEALRKATDIIATIGREVVRLNAYYNLKEYLKELSKAEVKNNFPLTSDASRVYAQVSRRLFNVIREDSFDYASAVSLVSDITPAVKTLNANGIYEGALSDPSSDSLYRFTIAMEVITSKLERSYSLTEALLACEEASYVVKGCAADAVDAYTKFGMLIFHHWLDRNSKYATLANFNKSEKELSKKHGKQINHITRKFFDTYPGAKDGKSGKGPTRLIALGIALVAVIALLVVGGIWLFGGEDDVKRSTDIEEKTTKYTISEEAVNEVKAYLDSFKDELHGDAVFVLAEVEETDTDPKENILKIYEDFDAKIMDDKLIVEYAPVNNKSKELFNLKDAKKGDKFIVPVQKTDDEKKVIARDLFKFDDKINKGYDFDKEYLVNDKNDTFCQNVIRYIGYCEKLVELEKKENKKADENVKGKSDYTITKEEVNEINEYLKSFKTQKNTNSALIVLAKVNKKTDTGYELKVEKDFDSPFKGTVVAVTAPSDTSKSYFGLDTDLDKSKLYAVVLQNGEEGKDIRARDYFEVPGGKIEDYDFNSDYTAHEEGAEFCKKVLKYVGYEADLVQIVESKKPDGTNGNEHNTPSQGDGEEQA